MRMSSRKHFLIQVFGNSAEPWRIILFGDTFQGEEDVRILAQ